MALPGAAQEIGTLTLLKDTPLHVIRGTAVLQGVEGMRLHAGDIFETGPSAGAQVQLEFTGGAVVELGPSTQVLVSSASAGGGDLVLAAGWLKGETMAGVYRYSSPLINASTKGGNVLVHATPDSAEVFVEHGTASVSGGAAAVTSAPGKIFFARKGGKPAVAADRPSGDFIGAMPICFRDALPPRLAAFAGKKTPAPKIDHEVAYADIERWLSLPAAFRRGLAARFRSRLSDPAFRQAIEAHESSLPEWGPYLHPENFQSSPAGAGKPSSPPGE
ncbi:hypothetical protein DYQ86_20135 [Acidobacteria bacterium AB60]|nr:hypothetical protein DYQ86_20135 [Acidobacteria bacterium AB60]